jgi:glutathione S-transferase
MPRILDVATASLSTLARGGLGLRVGALGPRPALPLELFEFEACPFCRKVREALSILDLDVVVYPCPKGGRRFRDRLLERGGKEQFPYLIDPNTGLEMYESDDIVRYLFDRYGDGPPPALLRAGALGDLNSVLSGLPRLAAGARVRASNAPDQPVELYSFEASPFCRLVREELTALEIPYLLHNVAKDSPSRDEFEKRAGKVMVPWLSDPNTGTELFESAEIVGYLRETYGADR